MQKGTHHTAEANRKNSITHKGRKSPLPKEHFIHIGTLSGIARRGIKLSEQHRKNIGLGNLGRTVSTETRSIMSEKMKIKSLGNSNALGHKVSDKSRLIIKQRRSLQKINHTLETKSKISNALHGHFVSEETKKKLRSHKRTDATKEKIRKNRLKQVFPLKDSSIEKKIQSQLKVANIPHKTHIPIIGQPDIFIEGNEFYKGIAIFADGCATHPCPIHKGRITKTFNDEEKIKYHSNITNQLFNDGYYVMRFWEHDIKQENFDILPILQEVIGNLNAK